MAYRVCQDCPTLIPPGTRSGRCPACERAREQARGSSAERGYGGAHRKERTARLDDAHGSLCHLCGEPMLPGQDLALDHTPDRTGYRGMAHASCNASDGARRGNAGRRGVT